MPILTLSNPGGLDQRSRVPNQLILEAENLGLAHDGWLVMRPGASAQSLEDSGFTGPIQWLGRHVTQAGAEELWGCAENAGPAAALARRAAGAWAAVSFSDTVDTDNLRYLHGATLNGKFFLAYDSNVNRLHVRDGTGLRRAGLIVPGAVPTTATLGGAGLTFDRYYRVRWVELSGTTVVRRSEPSASDFISISDDSGVQVTRPTAASEGETHWEVEYADAATGPWYRASQVLIATTTYNDTAATIDTTNLSNESGQHIPPPSAKFILSDGTRLLMAGAWESSAATGQTTPKANRVWFTPRLGSLSAGDDERIPDTADLQNYIDVGDGAEITGLAGPLHGEIYVFKQDSVWKLVATGLIDQPYIARIVTAHFGAVGQRCIVHGVGPSGEPAIYFCSRNAVFRITGGVGIQELSVPIGRDLRASSFNAATSFLAFDPASQQLFVNVTTTAPSFFGSYEQFTMDTRSGRWCGANFGGALSGWILGEGVLGTSTVLGETGAFLRVGVAAMASDNVTRLHLAGQNADDESALISWGSQLAADGDAPFPSSVRWRGVVAEGRRVSVGNPIVVYRNPTGSADTVASLTITLYREDGLLVTQTKTLESMSDSDPLSIRTIVFESIEAADTYVLDIRVSLQYTAGFSGEVWPGIDLIQVPFKVQESAVML